MQAHCPVLSCRPILSTLKLLYRNGTITHHHSSKCSPCRMKRLATTLKPLRNTKGVHSKASASGNSPKHDTHNPDSPWNPKRREFEEYRDTEEHPSYRRVDMSLEHAAAARRSFLSTISDGEGTMDLALAALYIAAEDDAIVSHSTVEFPIEAFQRRLHRLAMDVGTFVVLPLLEEPNSGGVGNDAILSAIIDYLFHNSDGMGALLRPPSFGRSNISSTTVVQHPGVWESPKMAYLHEVLITKRGIPSVLSIVLSDVLRRLFERGMIDFVARIDCQRDMNSVPSATIIPGISRDLVARSRPDFGETPSSMNMCTSDMLVESLTYLKRSYWPFEWDGLRGGWPAAARTFLDGSESAEMEAIARTAAHRLSRGIWTSPGAGDLSRAIAAAERLVISRGGSCPDERRDLGVLYCHAGKFPEAWSELNSYASSTISVGLEKLGDASNFHACGNSTAAAAARSDDCAVEDTFLLNRLLTVLQRNMNEEERGLVKPLDLQEGIRRCEQNVEVRFLPLTW